MSADHAVFPIAEHQRRHAMSEPIKVTVTDPDTGEVLGEQTIDNDYVVICAGDRYVAHTNAHANGTHVITIKRADR